jgi:hypothetical protein
MSDGLQDAIAGAGAALAGMTGLVRWHAEPPESLSEFPAGMVFSVSGEITAVSDGFDRGLHTLRVAVYLARAVLPEAVAAAQVWPYRVHNALKADQTLGGTVLAVVWPLRYRMGPMVYGSETLFGVAADVVVKV